MGVGNLDEEHPRTVPFLAWSTHAKRRTLPPVANRCAMREPALVVEHLAKRYDRTTALVDVSFTLDAGEIVGLIGPNCAGKSTAFGILCGLLRPDSGTMQYDGALLGRDRGPAERRRTAWCRSRGAVSRTRCRTPSICRRSWVR